MVFRKGSHSARNERWIMRGNQLEDVKSYTYFGFAFTTKLSTDKGPEFVNT